MERKKNGRKRKSKSERPFINEGFTEEEFSDLSKLREKTGLNWHDFIIELAENYIYESPTEMLK